MRRQWRVGSFSMGGALILLGSALFWYTWQGKEAMDLLMKGWPVLCILLGLEVLVYLFLSKQENPVLRYDLLSLFIVGLVGISCLGFAALSSTGLLGEIRYEAGSVERTVELEELATNVPEGVSRIVLQSYGINPFLEKVKTRELQVFGTYRTRTLPGEQDGEKVKAASIKTVGDTMFVTLLEPPVHRGLSYYHTWPTLTLVVPEGIPLEVRGTKQP